MYDPQAEWKLLSSLFVANEAIHRISVHLFTDTRIAMYESIESAFERYGDITLEGVRNVYEKKLPAEVTVNAVVNQQALIDHLANLARKRQLKERADMIELAIQKPVVDDSIVQSIITLEPILPEMDSGLQSSIRSVLTDIDLKKSGKYQWVLTGIKALDSLIREWFPQSVNIVMAAPGSGKTALVLQSMYNMALDNHRSRLLSLEMSKEQLLLRMVANTRDIDYGKLITGNLTEEEIASVEEGLHEINKLPIEIVDNGSITLSQIINDLYQFASRGGKIFFIDYAQIFPFDSDNRVHALGDLARRLKIVAKKLNLRIVLLSQINDQNEGLAAIRDSRELSHICDVIFQLESDQYPDPFGNKNVSIVVHKNKFGRTGRTAVLFDGSHQRFIGSDITE
jgi:replicative DNA helicase